MGLLDAGEIEQSKFGDSAIATIAEWRSIIVWSKGSRNEVFVRSGNVKCYAGKDFGSLDSTPSVVENVLGQLTESRGTNEDRL
jgi:hypothetical protein